MTWPSSLSYEIGALVEVGTPVEVGTQVEVVGKALLLLVEAKVPVGEKVEVGA